MRAAAFSFIMVIFSTHGRGVGVCVLGGRAAAGKKEEILKKDRKYKMTAME